MLKTSRFPLTLLLTYVQGLDNIEEGDIEDGPVDAEAAAPIVEGAPDVVAAATDATEASAPAVVSE
jgi:hypothetical protein